MLVRLLSSSVNCDVHVASTFAANGPLLCRLSPSLTLGYAFPILEAILLIWSKLI